MRRDQCLGYSDRFGRGDAGASEKADLQQLGCDLRRSRPSAILRAIEMVGRENVYFVIFEDSRFILDAMEIIPCVNAYNNRQSVCRNNLCMQAITVDDVLKKLRVFTIPFKRTTSGNSSAE
jgi:hypothetical protein